jgi:hypothetical protein
VIGEGRDIYNEKRKRGGGFVQSIVEELLGADLIIRPLGQL